LLLLQHLSHTTHKFHVKHNQSMKQIFLIVAIPLLSLGSTTIKHPIYVSITEVDYVSKKQEIQVALKIFTDDLEAAIRKEGKEVNLDTPKEIKNSNSYIKNYIDKHFKVNINHREDLQINYAGKEYIDDATWVYYSYKTSKKVKSITIQNTVIFDIHDSQKNLTHLRKDKKLVNSKYFTKKQTVFTFDIK